MSSRQRNGPQVAGGATGPAISSVCSGGPRHARMDCCVPLGASRAQSSADVSRHHWGPAPLGGRGHISAYLRNRDTPTHDTIYIYIYIYIYPYLSMSATSDFASVHLSIGLQSSPGGGRCLGFQTQRFVSCFDVVLSRHKPVFETRPEVGFACDALHCCYHTHTCTCMYTCVFIIWSATILACSAQRSSCLASLALCSFPPAHYQVARRG